LNYNYDKIVNESIKKYCSKKLRLTQTYLLKLFNDYSNDKDKHIVELTDVILHMTWKLIMQLQYGVPKEDKYDISMESYEYVLSMIHTIPIDGSVQVFNWLTTLVRTGIRKGWRKHFKKDDCIDVISYSNWEDINI